MIFKHALPLAAILAVLPVGAGQHLVGIAEAQAQQMGTDPWNYSRASRGFAANYQAIRRSQQGGGGGVGGNGSGAEVTYYFETTNTHVSSTAIANQSIINQTLGDGANGVVDTNLNQGSAGDQTADTAATSTTTITEYGSDGAE